MSRKKRKRKQAFERPAHLTDAEHARFGQPPIPPTPPGLRNGLSTPGTARAGRPKTPSPMPPRRHQNR